MMGGFVVGDTAGFDAKEGGALGTGGADEEDLRFALHMGEETLPV